MNIEAIKLYLEKMERIYFKQAVWDLGVVAYLIDRMVDGPIKLCYVRELRHCVNLNPVRLRWVWFHSDIRYMLNNISSKTK